MSQQSGSTRVLPLLPLRDIVVFPHMMVPLYVGRLRSIHAVEEAMRQGREILLAAQLQARTNEPGEKDIYGAGTLCRIVQHIKRPDGTMKVLVEGLRRQRLGRYLSHPHCLLVEASEITEPAETSAEQLALGRTVHEAFDDYARLSKRLQPDILASIRALDDPSRLADTIIAHLPLKHADKQEMLEIPQPRRRLERLCGLMQAEIEILQVERKIRTRVKKQMERTEKEYYLNEQMRAIQRELGDRDEFKSELGELEIKLRAKIMPDEARAKIEKEIRKLKLMSPMSAEATVVRNYVDWCLSLPWGDYASERLSLAAAEEVLDQDHFGLEKPKDRILEYLAVHALVERMRGPILCLIGPPGVGKTSLGRSIARATGRPFVRVSLGGVRDEAEIRGHRRTYIGALPGKIIQSLKRAGAGNPIVLLDEIDKMSADFRGDPSAALLEVLDPEQNASFNDHYLDVDYDLSRVMFVATANGSGGIPPPLLDRLEVIQIAGYTEPEKMAIAKRYLLPKQMRENGIGDLELTWQDRALRTLIRRYTREAGVRTLEREVASICRKLARQMVDERPSHQATDDQLTHTRVRAMLGPPKFQARRRERQAEIGMATGLAWTQNGGEILKIEAIAVPGRGKLVATGKLGEVMRESAQAALSYVRERAASWGLAPDFYASIDIHVHVPDGAIPKDGPSAGITIATALVSALTKVPVRHDIAMTGEITVRGCVLGIGGLKEKALAAHAAQIGQLILPRENHKDIGEIPRAVARKLTLVTVTHMDDVLRHALVLTDDHALRARPAAAAATPPVVAPATDNGGGHRHGPPQPALQEH